MNRKKGRWIEIKVDRQRERQIKEKGRSDGKERKADGQRERQTDREKERWIERKIKNLNKYEDDRQIENERRPIIHCHVKGLVIYFYKCIYKYIYVQLHLYTVYIIIYIVIYICSGPVTLCKIRSFNLLAQTRNLHKHIHTPFTQQIPDRHTLLSHNKYLTDTHSFHTTHPDKNTRIIYIFFLIISQ